LAQILVDENVPISVMEWLKSRGFSVQRVSEAGLRGSRDEDIARYAVRNNMVVLTLDRDFAHLYHNVFRGLLSVVVVRVKPLTPTNIIKALDTTLRKIRLDQLEKKLTVITERKVRIIA